MAVDEDVSAGGDAVGCEEDLFVGKREGEGKGGGVEPRRLEGCCGDD